MKTRFFLIASICCAALFMVGCGDSSSSSPTSQTNNSPLVGTWNMTSQVTTHASGNAVTTTITANNANKYAISADNTLSETMGTTFVTPGTWSATADSVTITTIAVTKCKYSISGTTLTLTYGFAVTGDSGTITETYAKQ